MPRMKQRSAVLTLITVICAFYLWELVDSGIIGTFALYGIDLLKVTNEWYRLLTVALIHDNSSTIPIHLAFNMIALHSLGTPIETLLGRSKFLIIFFAKEGWLCMETPIILVPGANFLIIFVASIPEKGLILMSRMAMSGFMSVISSMRLFVLS